MTLIRHWFGKREPRLDTWPDYARTYWKEKGNSDQRGKEISTLRIVVLDTESSQKKKSESLLLSFAGLGIQGKQIHFGDYLQLLISPSHYIPSESIFIHGITPQNSRLGISLQEAFPQILRFIGSSVLVAHHARHDITLLQSTLRRVIPDFTFYNAVLDTVQLAIRLENPVLLRREYIQPKSYTLDALARRYNIPIVDRHTAYGDSFITAQLLLRLLHRYEQKGMTQLKQIQKRGLLF